MSQNDTNGRDPEETASRGASALGRLLDLDSLITHYIYLCILIIITIPEQ